MIDNGFALQIAPWPVLTEELRRRLIGPSIRNGAMKPWGFAEIGQPHRQAAKRRCARSVGSPRLSEAWIASSLRSSQ
jgi:hypothetical protein